MLVSRRYTGSLSMTKLVPIGVGKLGTAIGGSLRCAAVEGAFGESSNTSVADAVMLRFLKLEDEKFFLKPTALAVKRPGELGIDEALFSISGGVFFDGTDVAGAVPAAASFEPGPLG